MIQPVVFAPAPHPVSPGGESLTRLAAAQAQSIGMPTLAASLYREALRAPGADRASLDLALASSLLDAGLPTEAEAALADAPNPSTAAWHLRHALAESALRHNPAARAEAEQIIPAELPSGDQAWYLDLQGAVAAAGGDPVRAADLFLQASHRAESSLARARFILFREEQFLRTGRATEDGLRAAQQGASRFQGQATGLDYARTAAVMLYELGRKTDAIHALEDDLRQVAPTDHARVDDFHLLLGLIAGPADGDGRRALAQLVEFGDDEDRRRVALQLLADASASGPPRDEFRTLLDRMIADPTNTKSPLLDDLLLFRAVAAVDEGRGDDAQQFAERLLTSFPGSELRPYAFAVETRAAWNQRRYRAAAALAAKARDAASWADGRALFGVVIAEAWFRAGDRAGDAADFRAAADAYAAALRGLPSSMPPGELMFQRIESEIRAGSLARAAAVIDELAHAAGFNVVDRWRAEYNLIREERVRGDLNAAYARVNLVLNEPLGPGMPPELRGRMVWLQAQLSADAADYAQTVQLGSRIAANLRGVPEPLRTQIISQGELLQAKALFALHRVPEAQALLQRLQAEHPDEDASLESYVLEADEAAASDRIVEARRLYIELAEKHRGAVGYADYALFQAAKLAERAGQPDDLGQAQELIEQLVTRYPQSPLVFDARRDEGDLLRRRNLFDQAQQAYESLINRFPDHPDAVLARLALADCHAALADDPGHAEKAVSLYSAVLEREDLQARPGGTDIRIEAGYKLGALYRMHGRRDEAQDVWFSQVVHRFFLDPARAAELGATGRYWMARTLLDLGDLFQSAGRTDEARSAWELITRTGLPGSADLARKRLSLAGPAGTQ